MSQRTKEKDLLEAFVGAWTTEATHPEMPGVVVHGTATVEWLEGEKFLIHRARTDHPEFPDSISIIGHMGRDRAEGDDDGALVMHYFDSRGVFREYAATAAERVLRFERDAPGMAQRYAGTFDESGDVITGQWQMRPEGTWTDDLQITYRRDHDRAPANDRRSSASK